MDQIDEERRHARGYGLRDCLLMALVFYSLTPCDASAGEPTQSPEARREKGTQKSALQTTGPLFPAPFSFAGTSAAEQEFSATEFRPRKRTVLEPAAAGSDAAVIDTLMARDTSLARELSQARTQDRVRLLTLWQNRASSLSLQAGKRGAPSLQWSTPWMHRDAASRGLFDRLLADSPRNFSNALRSGVSRQTATLAPAKSLDLGTTTSAK
jgi:hypothetical protein